MSYSEDYRKRTIKYRGEGHTLAGTHKVFMVSIGMICTGENQWKEKGTLSRAPVVRSYKKIEPEKLTPPSSIAAHPRGLHKLACLGISQSRPQLLCFYVRRGHAVFVLSVRNVGNFLK